MTIPTENVHHRSAVKFLIAIVASLSLFAFEAPAAPVELKVMSFNVRLSRGLPMEPAAENDWADAKHPRRARAIQVVHECAPDLLGVQEARDIQVNDLREALPDYEFYGQGRDDGETGGEFAGIFFRKDRFELKDKGTFWLSATPEKPGTSFYTALTAVPRIASWARLADRKSGREFVYLNMHWDHINKPARVKSAALVRQRLAEVAKGVPAIVSGDLNAAEDSREVNELVGFNDPSGPQLTDTYRKLIPQRSKDESTFNHWTGTKEGPRIDFILCTNEFEPVQADIIRTAYEGLYPSDHYPISATLRIESAEKPSQ